jgi:hypothetical protein
MNPRMAKLKGKGNITLILVRMKKIKQKLTDMLNDFNLF